jgi:hypothetical protein
MTPLALPYSLKKWSVLKNEKKLHNRVTSKKSTFNVVSPDPAFYLNTDPADKEPFWSYV